MKTIRSLFLMGSAVALVATLGQCSDNSPANTSPDLSTALDLSTPADLATPSPPDLTLLAAAPTITAIAPARGLDTGGTALTITGTGFQSQATVMVAGVACLNPTVVSATSITCTTAARAATCGLVAVVVTNPDAQKATDTTHFSLYGKALGLSAATNIPLGTNPQFLKVADVNADGKPDLLVANAGANTLSVRLGKGDGSFLAAADLPISAVTTATAATIATGDVSGDGKLDIVVTLPAQGQVSVLLGNGNGTFGAAAQFSAGSQPFGIAVGDANGN